MIRAKSISGTSGTLASYKYLGAGQIVEEDYESADMKLSYLNAAGTNVAGLDRFGRVIDQVWTNASNQTIDEYL